MNRPYIINDAEGNPINAKYPPDKGTKQGRNSGDFARLHKHSVYNYFPPILNLYIACSMT